MDRRAAIRLAICPLCCAPLATRSQAFARSVPWPCVSCWSTCGRTCGVARLRSWPGPRKPSVSLDLHVEHALVAVGASLAQCAAVTDIAFYAWVSATTTSSVREQHMFDTAHQLQRHRRALTSSRRNEASDTETSRDNAA